jgi:hypothetical protein
VSLCTQFAYTPFITLRSRNIDSQQFMFGSRHDLLSFYVDPDMIYCQDYAQIYYGGWMTITIDLNVSDPDMMSVNVMTMLMFTKEVTFPLLMN